jgi:DNA-binding CsgD family transcriptional regulator
MATKEPATNHACYIPPALANSLARTSDATRQVRIWADAAPCPSVVELQARFHLTPTQARVAQMLAARRTNAEIAALLDISIHTARRHVEAVLLRLDVNSRLAAERKLLTRGDSMYAAQGLLSSIE